MEENKSEVFKKDNLRILKAKRQKIGSVKRYYDGFSEVGCRNSDTINNQLTIHLVKDFKNFLSLREYWDQLVVRSDSTIFQTFDWQLLWWKHFGANHDGELHILLLQHNSKLVGIFPLFLDVTRLFGYQLYKRLRFIGSGVQSDYADGMLGKQGPSDFLDVIILPEYRSIAISKFINYLRDHPFYYDEIEFVSIPEGSVLRKEFLNELVQQNISYSIRKSDICPRLHTSKSISDYVANLNPSVRRRFSHTRKMISEKKDCSLETVTTLKTLKGVFKDLVHLHQVRWNRMGYPGLFADDRFEHFLDEVSQSFGKRGWIWLKTIKIHTNGSPEVSQSDSQEQNNQRHIAIRMGFKFKNQLYDYLSGFDNQSLYSKYRPGLALLFSMIEDAHKFGYHTVEFLRGNENYKFDLTSEYSSNWQITVENPVHRSNLRRALYLFKFMLEDLRHRFVYERLLLNIHCEQYDFPNCIIEYLKFRIRNLSRKIAQFAAKRLK